MKIIYITILAVLCIALAAPAGYADLGDLMTEGKVVIEKSQLLIQKGEMMKAYKGQDKAWMVDQGHQMIKVGLDITEAGEMMNTERGRSNTQEIGASMRSAGNMLLKMGRKQEPLTEKDKENIIKHGETLISLGTLKLNEGKMMAP